MLQLRLLADVGGLLSINSVCNAIMGEERVFETRRRRSREAGGVERRGERGEKKRKYSGRRDPTTHVRI
jgi:hypothetical protein